ncbi:hypothetical protein ABW22_05695 [Thiobacillus denitrificans]|uniref:Uncharacterized protein n=1 Tax=Thiobacillus denitrificans TaxID=36861 RepID=A0A106BQS2_THIDE|nr:hypothetical protein ABW22_05695 [Thiobacillus denitrificans]
MGLDKLERGDAVAHFLGFNFDEPIIFERFLQGLHPDGLVVEDVAAHEFGYILDRRERHGIF